ncbi:phosphate/phosphite/phosphonate ABC transporter substrate-binding protein [Stappia sp. F7233]|uniref:Phosphate/phosphite/phosphonate ABC transporter substrate-binding protein n=1 Tax=Stappia albiluteola TaxID=2758565 RepID=A0A839A9Z9_9HYPH|nr:PhnD/SsuA/transferrin family substrate-binding protein [Stappia albiluteola]MBA5776241.1 phosphate/phosphite/phosphonate ABC transporter substrate-binding protein [Stappia albiluteola]
MFALPVLAQDIADEEGAEPEVYEYDQPLPDDYDAPWDTQGPVTWSVPLDPEIYAVLPTLRIGVVVKAVDDPDRRGFLRYEAFRAGLEQALGVPANLVAYGSLARLQQAIVNGEVHYAPLSASAFADAWQRCRCIEPLGVQLAVDGTPAYHAVILVRTGSDFGELADLEGAKLAAPPPFSVASYRVPLAAMRREGLEPGTFFSSIVQADGPIRAAELVMTGAADASLGWSSLEGDEAAGFSRGTLRDMVARGIMEPRSLKVIWASRAIPNPPHAIRKNLPPIVRERLAEFLMSWRQADETGVETGFVQARAEDFAPLLEPLENAATPLTGSGRLREVTTPKE